MFGLEVTPSFKCTGCDQRVHAQGFADTVTCPHCARDNAMPLGWWLRAFSEDILEEHRRRGPDKSIDFENLGGPGLRVHWRAVSPRCPGCEAPIAAESLDAAVQRGFLDCACGQRLAVREAPARARVILPGIRWLVGEGADVSADAAVTSTTGCATCGAPLTIDGKARAVPCRYCSATTVLDAALWKQLHPVLPSRTFTLLSEVSHEQALSFARGKLLARRRSVALPVEVARELAADTLDECRMLAACQASLDEELLSALAADQDPDVRGALALNPDCPPDILEQLALGDPSNRPLGRARGSGQLGILARVAQHPSTPERVMATIGLSDPPQVRAALVRNRAYPADRLGGWLASETDAQVLIAAANRADLPLGVLNAWATPNPAVTVDNGAIAAARGAELRLARQLLKHDNPSVLRALAGREDADAPMLLALGRSRHKSVADRAQRHPGYAAAVARRRWRIAAITTAAVLLLSCAGVVAAIGGGVALFVMP